jgi:hypothetical protein
MPAPAEHRRGRERHAEAPDPQAPPDVAQLVAIGVREVARIAVGAPHETGHSLTVGGIEAIPVIATGAQDLEDDQPGGKASQHDGGLPADGLPRTCLRLGTEKADGLAAHPA